MIRLQELEEAMKGQFVFDKKAYKRMQVLEDYEGNKDLARNVFVGLADMLGFDAGQIMDHLDMGYDSYRNKLMQFREYYRIGKARELDGSLKESDDAIKKFYVKVGLCLNSIRTKTRRDPYLKMEEYINI